jgi:hypothetical protein
MKAAFYKGTHPGIPGLYNRFVRWWTRGIYSHAEIVFSDWTSASSSFMDGGVRLKKIKFDPAIWDFIDLPDDWMNLRFCFGFMPDSKDKYACSEACMASLVFTDSWRFDPNAMASILRRLYVRTL